MICKVFIAHIASNLSFKRQSVKNQDIFDYDRKIYYSHIHFIRGDYFRYVTNKFPKFLFLYSRNFDSIAIPTVNHGVGVINGDSAKPGQFPYLVSVLQGDQNLCGGTILNKNWILTAAHLVILHPIETLHILAGTNLLHSGGVVYNVTKLVPHSDFDSSNFKNDLCLIKIDGEFEFNDLVQPIGIGDANVNDTVTIAGWEIAEDTDHPEDLRYMESRALSNEECVERTENITVDYYFGPELLCVLASDVSKGPCHGDSGGPLISNEELVGVASYAFTPCAKGTPDTYTRPTAYSKWINEIIQES